MGHYVNDTFSLKISSSLRSGRRAITTDKSIVAVCFVHDSEVWARAVGYTQQGLAI